MAKMTRLLNVAFRLFQAVPFLRYHIRFDVPVTVGATTLKIPIIEGQYPQYEDYEPWLLTALARIFSARAGAFVDVGANRGQTLLKVAAIDRERAYVGFEPNVFCALMVRQIIEANRLPRHEVVPMGLAERLATVELLVSATGSESCTTAQGVRSRGAYISRQRVAVADGDTLLNDLALDGIALIKIDVEGAELEVLRGLRRTLAERRPWLIFEVLPPALVDGAEARLNSPERAVVTALNRARALAVEALLRDADYAFWNIYGEGRLRMVPTFDMGPGADLSMSNFIATPTSDATALQMLFTLDDAAA